MSSCSVGVSGPSQTSVAAANKEGQAAASVTQVIFGGSIGTFYITVPMESLADISKMGGARNILGEEAYRTYSQMAAENYISAGYTLPARRSGVEQPSGVLPGIESKALDCEAGRRCETKTGK